MSEPVDEIRVGDERSTEGDRVASAAGNGSLGPVTVIVTIEDERPVVCRADQRCSRCQIGRHGMTGTGFGFEDVQIGKTKAVQQLRRSREGGLGRGIGNAVVV